MTDHSQKLGTLWTGTISWASGEGGTPGTQKYLRVLDAEAHTLQGASAAPTTYAQVMPSDSLERWVRLALWIEATKTVGSTNIPWANKQLALWPMASPELAPQPFQFPGSGHYHIYADMGDGGLANANRNLFTLWGANNPFPDNAANGSTYAGLIIISANPASLTSQPLGIVSAAILLQPNVAIAATQTFSVRMRFIQAR